MSDGCKQCGCHEYEHAEDGRIFCMNCGFNCERCTPGPWTFSPQEGKPGNCKQARVMSGAAVLAWIEPERDPSEATANAAMMAAAHALFNALETLKTAGATEIIRDGRGCTAGYIAAERVAIDALAQARGESTLAPAESSSHT